MPGYRGQVTRPWDADEEALVISNRAAGIDDEVTARQVGREVGAVERRALMLKASKKRVRLNRSQAAQAAESIFGYLREIIERGDPSPVTTDIMRATGLRKSTVIKGVLDLAAKGRLSIEYFNSQTRAFTIPGVGTALPTQRASGPLQSGELVTHGRVIEKPGADAIFAGIRFADAPVRRDPRRAPLYATQVASRVEGAW